MRVMWSTTMRCLPPAQPITLSQNAPWVPFSKCPITLSTDCSSATRSTTSVISSMSSPRPRPMRRMLPPHTMVGMDGSSIIGTSSIEPPNPHDTRTA